jgi:exosortase/archaeosortase family protein
MARGPKQRRSQGSRLAARSNHAQGERHSSSVADTGLGSGNERESASNRNKSGARRKKRPVLRAVIIFVVVMGAFYGFVHTPYVSDEPFHRYLQFIAKTTGGILGVCGYDITVTDRKISSPEFSMLIVRGCDAIEPVGALAAAVLASPVSFWLKLPGIVAGTLALLVINLARLASLFVVGIYFPKFFDLIHMEIWQALFIVLAICLWAIWIQWAMRWERSKVAH